jgi:PmbA protein
MMNFREIAGKILTLSKSAGADKAEVFIQSSYSTSFSVSEMKVEFSNRAKSQGYGLSFIKNNRRVFVNSSDFKVTSIKETIDKASELVKFAEEDPFIEIAQKGFRLRSYDILDHGLEKIPLETKIAYAMDVEKDALKYDKRIKKASSVSYNETIQEKAIANTNGVFGYYPCSLVKMEAGVLAIQGEERQEGDFGMKKHFYKDLYPASEIAKRACFMAISLIGGKSVKTTKVPIIFDPSTGWSIMRYGIFEAVNANNILKNSSYFVDRIGKKVASDLVTIIDDGTMPEGVSTAPFDDEGTQTRKNVIIENGILKMYVYDLYSAKKGKAQPTGNASRESYRDTPHLEPRNLYMVKGDKTPQELISEVKNGFWVKNTIGFGVDAVTGSYSIGAAGRWIKDGKLTEAVSGVTIACSLDELLTGIDRIGNDLEFNYENASPTFRVSSMTVSGL